MEESHVLDSLMLFCDGRGPRNGMRLLSMLLFVACQPKDQVNCSLCDPETEICVIDGSDVSTEPKTSRCEPLPSDCSADATCDCVEQNAASMSTVNLEFCFENGECNDGEPVEVTCPGG